MVESGSVDAYVCERVVGWAFGAGWAGGQPWALPRFERPFGAKVPGRAGG